MTTRRRIDGIEYLDDLPVFTTQADERIADLERQLAEVTAERDAWKASCVEAAKTANVWADKCYVSEQKNDTLREALRPRSVRKEKPPLSNAPVLVRTAFAITQPWQFSTGYVINEMPGYFLEWLPWPLPQPPADLVQREESENG